MHLQLSFVERARQLGWRRRCVSPPSENKPRRRKGGFAPALHPSRDRYADSRKRFAVAHLGPIKIALNYGCPRRAPLLLLLLLLLPLISKFMNPPQGTGGTTTVFVERWKEDLINRRFGYEIASFSRDGRKKETDYKTGGNVSVYLVGWCTIAETRVWWEERARTLRFGEEWWFFTVGWRGIFIPLGVNRVSALGGVRFYGDGWI